MARTPMKLILTQEVSGLGTPGDVVDVEAGYGRNYLIPRGFAMALDPRRREAGRPDQAGQGGAGDPRAEDAQGGAAQLQRLQVRMRRRAGGNGRLFGSVGPADIAAAVREAGGPELDRRRIEVRDPIKTLGSHKVQVRLHPEVSAAVDIEIIAS